LIARDPSNDSEVRRNRLLELQALLHGAIVLAAEAAAKEDRIEHLRIGRFEKAGIQILQ
jgi:hypothetical protein